MTEPSDTPRQQTEPELLLNKSLMGTNGYAEFIRVAYCIARDLAAARAEHRKTKEALQRIACIVDIPEGRHGTITSDWDGVVEACRTQQADRDRLAAEHQDALVTVASFKAANDRLAAEVAEYKRDAGRWRKFMEIGWDEGFDAYDPEGCEVIVDAALAQVKEPAP